ncbi:hypothetical protein GCM10020367_61100 [Streptomyces sannanensis]|uniref:Uncharacterized protein n=1 Tax=Streptomyces sannanensis TaxID=285536 RepID=A0ABP6SKL1_9ACTN
MNNGIYIPASTVRFAVGVISAAAVTALISQLPAIRRYFRLARM